MTTKELSIEIKSEILKMANKAKSSHVGSALSIADILAVLYNEFIRFNKNDPSYINRDRFILSKGHACSALYATLALKGFFKLDDLDNYAKNDSEYMAHVSHKVKGVEFSTGSLGHGLPFATGIAVALNKKNIDSKVFVLIGDGELSEGSNFESMLFAAHNKLKNLILIIDNNNLQSLTTVDKTLNLYPFKSKFESFDWEFYSCDGNNVLELSKTLNKILTSKKNTPKVLIAKTIKGSGVSFMENKVEWHYKSPNDKELKRALKEINNEK